MGFVNFTQTSSRQNAKPLLLLLGMLELVTTGFKTDGAGFLNLLCHRAVFEKFEQHWCKEEVEETEFLLIREQDFLIDLIEVSLN